MMIDFALVAEREHGKNPADAIFEACMLRFRPILMTTMAALFGALPLGLWHRHGIGAAAAAGHHDCWWFDLQPDAHSLYHSGGLPGGRLGALVGAGQAARRVPSATGPASHRKRYQLERTTAMRNQSTYYRTKQAAQPRRLAALVSLAIPLALAGCTVGPKYHQPPAIATAPPPPAYKEIPKPSPIPVAEWHSRRHGVGAGSTQRCDVARQVVGDLQRA